MGHLGSGKFEVEAGQQGQAGRLVFSGVEQGKPDKEKIASVVKDIIDM